MNIESELLNKLAVRVIRYMNSDLNLGDINESFNICEVEALEFLDVSTLIALNGDFSGTIALSVSDDLSKKMVKNFIYGTIKESQIKELAGENVAETLNITLGNILPEVNLVKDGGNLDISTPYVMRNKVSITKKKDGKILLCKIEYGDESILLSYFN